MDKMKTQKSTHASPRKVCDKKNFKKKNKKNEIRVKIFLVKGQLFKSCTRRLAERI